MNKIDDSACFWEVNLQLLGDVNPSRNITGAVFHQLQPMNNTTGNDEVTIKVEIDDPYYDGMESVGW